MARLVYACRFDVVGDDGFKSVIATYQDWISKHYRDKLRVVEFNFDPTFAGNHKVTLDHTLLSSIYMDDQEQAVRIVWSFPDDKDNGLRWSNEIRIGQFGDRCGIEHLISIESVEYNVSPARLIFGSPRAVREMCVKTTAYIGEMQVRAEPYTLTQDGLDDFLTLLTSDLRKLPLVLLSPYAGGDINQIDATKLARNLAGVAIVVRVDDPEITWDIADEIGRQLSCFHGAARIYWPGFSRTSNPQSHRLFLGAWIEQVGAQAAARAIERAIFSVAAFRYVPDERISNLIRRTEAAERQKLLVEKKDTGEDFWADYDRDLARLEDVEKQLEELKAENANLRANQQVFFTSTTESLEDFPQTDQLSFSSVAEAVRSAAERCENIEILGSAYSSAEISPFQRPYDVFKALTDLNEIVTVWKRNKEEKGNGGDLLSHLRERGWGKRSSMHISSYARTKLHSSYEFEYQNQKRLFEPHITIGSGDPNSCASIHFIFDQERLKMIIGHVGKHLPNTKT